MQGMFKNPLVLALLASVLINGVLIGKAMTPKPDRPSGQSARSQPGSPPPGARNRLDALPRYLSPEQRARFDEAAKASGRKDMRKAFTDLRRARKTVNDLAKTDPFDGEKLRAAMADVREKSNALSLLSDNTIAAFLETATAEERIEIITAMRKAGRKGRKGPKGLKGNRKDRPGKQGPDRP